MGYGSGFLGHFIFEGLYPLSSLFGQIFRFIFQCVEFIGDRIDKVIEFIFQVPAPVRDSFTGL
jgi:hypothetical protein